MTALLARWTEWVDNNMLGKLRLKNIIKINIIEIINDNSYWNGNVWEMDSVCRSIKSWKLLFVISKCNNIYICFIFIH